MSRREDIDNAIWSDPDFEELSLEATTLYLWSWTNPRCGMGGIYKVSRRAMTESKVPADRLDAALAELAAARFAFHEDGVIFVRTRVKHLRTRTEQIAKSIRTDLSKIAADHPLRKMWTQENAAAPWLVRFLGAGWEHPESEVHANVSQTSPDPHAVGSLEPDPRSSVEGQSTLNGKGNGTGKGNGLRGRGAGRGSVVPEPVPYKPNLKLRALAAEHFPDEPPETIENAGVWLRDRGVDPTPEALLAHLTEVRADLAHLKAGGAA